MNNPALFEVLIYLLKEQKSKAQDIADKFNISVRTVYRYVDYLCKMNIPVQRMSGKEGGIWIASGYKIQTNYFTDREKKIIMQSLKTFKAICDEEVDKIIEKLYSITEVSTNDLYINTDNFAIDAETWQNRGSSYMNKLKTVIFACNEQRTLNIDYTNTHGEKANRDIDIYRIVFKDSIFLQAFCRMKNDFRLFKLSRISNCSLKDKFNKLPYNLPVLTTDFVKTQPTSCCFEIEKSVIPYFEDWLGVETIINSLDRTIVYANLPLDEYNITKLFAVSDKIKVIEPKSLKSTFKQKLQKLEEKLND